LNGVPWLEPEQVSRAVLFLADEDAAEVTGTVLDVVGGSRR
jgi:NAD(P)-dependent dehydrogenase (short-subunit alcohol dehydrogenase family)